MYIRSHLSDCVLRNRQHHCCSHAEDTDGILEPLRENSLIVTECIDVHLKWAWLPFCGRKSGIICILQTFYTDPWKSKPPCPVPSEIFLSGCKKTADSAPESHVPEQFCRHLQVWLVHTSAIVRWNLISASSSVQCSSAVATGRGMLGCPISPAGSATLTLIGGCTVCNLIPLKTNWCKAHYHLGESSPKIGACYKFREQTLSIRMSFCWIAVCSWTDLCFCFFMALADIQAAIPPKQQLCLRLIDCALNSTLKWLWSLE